MNDRDQRNYERLTRVQTFGDDHAAEFTPTSKATALFAEIDKHIVGLDDAKAGQTPARVSKETLLEALSAHFRIISRTARAIALTDHGFSAPYRIPDNPSELAHATHADALLERLEDKADDTPATLAAKAALRTRFIEFEMPDDFVTELRADLDALRGTNQHNQGEDQEGVGNTALISHILSQANHDVQRLDAIMHNKYRDQPDTLRAWRTASHIERAPQRRKDDEPTPPAPPTPPPA